MARSVNDLVVEALHDDFSASKYGARARQAIRDAVDDISRQASLPALEGVWTPALVAGTSSYNMPADVVRIRSAYYTDSRDVPVETSPEELDYLTVEASTGRPSSYAIVAGAVTFYPTPNAAYPIRFRYRKQTPVLADADTPATYLDEEFEQALVSFARGRLFAFEEDAEMAVFWQGDYDRWLQRIKAHYGRRSTRRGRRIAGMWGRPTSFIRS